MICVRKLKAEKSIAKLFWSILFELIFVYFLILKKVRELGFTYLPFKANFNEIGSIDVTLDFWKLFY